MNEKIKYIFISAGLIFAIVATIYKLDFLGWMSVILFSGGLVLLISENILNNNQTTERRSS